MRSSATGSLLLYAATFAMPAVLLFSSVRTFRELDAQREVYLRERAASIAGLLEGAAAQDEPIHSAVASIVEGEPHVVNLQVAPRSANGEDTALEAVWSGRELFHTEFIQTGGIRVYRAYVPFHSNGVMNVAQIDLSEAASDFLVVHARHNVIISVAGGVALVLISLYSLWASRRAGILERRQLELQHLAQLGTMSAVLAHEIRNPLGAIKGFAQLALEQAGDSLKLLLNPVLEQTKRLESLVDDLLVYGRPPAPNVRSVDWADIGGRIETHAHRLVDGRAVRVTVEKPRLSLETDPDLVEHILVNLVRNAIDAADGTPDAEVRVTAEAFAGKLVLAVRDNGAGIPETDLAKVREPFFTTKAFGTGLGLPICARLARVMNGTFEIARAAPRGTVASVRFPLKG